VAFEDDRVYPILVLEDLSDADWEVTWDRGRVALVYAALAELAASEPPPNTRPVRETFAAAGASWKRIPSRSSPRAFARASGSRARRPG